MMAATIIGCSGLSGLAQPLELLPFLPKWNAFFTLRTDGGYRDNVTLSHFAPEASPYVSVGGDAIVSRLYLDGSQLNFFLNADARYYFSAPSVDTEQLVFGQAQVRKVLDDSSEISVTAEYVHMDQVVDVSTTTDIPRPVPAVGHRVGVRLGFRKQLDPAFWFSLEVPAARQFFEAPLYDYWELGARFELGQELGNKSSLVLSFQPAYLAYDSAEQIAADGAPLPGTQRAFVRPDLRLTWRQHWDRARHWRTTAKVGCRINDDNASGYFNFLEPYASGEIRYRSRAWEISAGARVSYYDYRVQAVSETNPANRERSEVTVNVRVQRRLYRSLSLVATYEHEQVFSNDTLETYTVNTVSGGLQWEF